jgi:hypothetical protein
MQVTKMASRSLIEDQGVIREQQVGDVNHGRPRTHRKA